MVDVLTIDYETRSPIDIKRCGAYAYAASSYTSPMMLAIKEDDHETRMWIAPYFRNLMETEVGDDELRKLIQEAGVIVAHNAFFERSITHFHMPFELPLERVRCTMAQSCMCGLPRDLDSVARIVSGGKYLKDRDGHTLMLAMSKPRRLVKTDCERLQPLFVQMGYSDVESDWRKIQAMQKSVLEELAVGRLPVDKRLLPYFLVYRESQEEFVRLVEYARQDVRVEYMIYTKLPKLPEAELKVWQLDQRINDRGVQVDVVNAEGISRTLEKYIKELGEEALALTDYEVTSIKSPTSIIKWLRKHGVDVTSIDKESIKYLLTLDLDPKVRKFLEIRQALGKSSVAKYDTLLAEAFYDNRCHGLFVYHGAGPGRWAGAGVQPQNLPRPSGPKNLVSADLYGKEEVYADELDATMLASGDIGAVKLFWKDLMVLSADLLRTMFMAPEGKDFACADYSAVEARGLPWLAGQEDVLRAFVAGLDIYKVAASGIYKIPYEEVDGGGKGEQRQVGKTAILACLAGESEILTDEGWVAIRLVTKDHKLWDGEKWTQHNGVICNGVRKVIDLDGIRLTPDHLLFDGSSWKQASNFLQEPESMKSALKSGEEGFLMYESFRRQFGIESCRISYDAKDAEVKGGIGLLQFRTWRCLIAYFVNHLVLQLQKRPFLRKLWRTRLLERDLGLLPSSEPRDETFIQDQKLSGAWSIACLCSAIAERALIGFTKLTSLQGKRRDARFVLRKRPIGHSVKRKRIWCLFARIASYAESCIMSFYNRLRGALTQNARLMNIMVGGESNFAFQGNVRPSNTYCRSRIVGSRGIPLTELTTTAITSLETYDLPQQSNNWKTEEASSICKGKLTDCVPVYDILNAGDKNRFLVRSKSGAVWAHNCGYGGGYNAMLRFGADKLGINEEEGTAIVKAWREANSKIVEFWYALTRASVKAMQSPGDRFYAGKYISFKKQGDFLTMRLPSGRNLYYPYPKLESVEMPWSTETKPVYKKVVTAMTQNVAKQWVREPLSHVKLSENATQATCRDLLVNAMFNLTEAGYDIVLHVHDEICAEVDEGKGNLAEFEALMAKLPDWAEGFPLKAEGWIGKRYRK